MKHHQQFVSDIVLPLNVVEKAQMEVLAEHSAAHIGSGSVAVLSTPMMILYMEKTARIWLQTYLRNGLTSVGTKVCVEHLAGVKVGEIVETRIWVTEQDRRRRKGSGSDLYIEYAWSSNNS